MAEEAEASTQAIIDGLMKMADILEGDGQLQETAEQIKPTKESPDVKAPVQAAAAKPESTRTANQPGGVVNPNLGGFVIQHVGSRQRYLKAMIYGDYGVGKTYLTGTAEDIPEMRDILMISAESGDMTLSDRNFDVIPVSTLKQMARVFEFLKLHVRLRDAGDMEKLADLQQKYMGVRPTKKSEIRMYRTIIIDSLSEIQKYVMYQLLNINPQTTKLDDEPTPAQFKEWGQGGEMVRLMVRAFRDLPVNVIFVASQRAKEDEAKRVHYSPNFPGGLGGDIQGFVDFVGFYRMAVDTSDSANPKRVRRLHIAPTSQIQAKSRLRALDGLTHIDNPTMRDIMKGMVKE